ncbi:hypothetical protein [Campylobacter sp.]|uniref:hypothetical protein n=1 Tax=Campylobacter sp. TaxID=205 RepID=UPI002A75B78F|nr:hypothetical protein [Campylobacter sp.]MDY3246331.1 hypothetical protein [Campylobacter sp.]MDY4803748.1 hypothetical protein [Campylobacter sp.]
MKVCLSEIYDKLKAWRDARGITAASQKQGYIVNVMEEFGELAEAIRNDENWTTCDLQYFKKHKQAAKYEIIDALCDIAVFTINAGADIPCHLKHTEIEWGKSSLNADYILKQMVEKCAEFSYSQWDEAKCFNIILANCAYLCGHYGYNFQLAMNETIKEISSRTGSYNEATKKWEKDMSNEAQAKWYRANYEKAKIRND